MNIKKIPNSRRVVVEWMDPLVESLHPSKEIDIIEHMDKNCARRISYNMWEFESEEDAKRAIFILELKN